MVDHLGDDPSPVFVRCGFSTPGVQRGPVDFSFCNTGPHARRAAHIASLLFLIFFLRSTMCYLVLSRILQHSFIAVFAKSPACSA